MTNLEKYLSDLADRLEATTDEEELAEEIDSAVEVYYIRFCDDRLAGVRLLLTCGGPNVWLDTELGMLIGAWGTARQTCYISSGLCDRITEYFNI